MDRTARSKFLAIFLNGMLILIRPLRKAPGELARMSQLNLGFLGTGRV